MSNPAGWYDDGSGRQRWWDGGQWTDQFADQQSVAAPGGVAVAAPPSPESPKTKPGVLGIIALVVAAIGFVFACIPGALIVGWVLLPIAFILSIVALFLKGSKWPAITGLALAVVGTVVGFVVFFALMANAASNAFNEIRDSVPGDDSPGVAEPAEPAAEDQPGAATSEYAVTIDGASQATDYEGNPAIVVEFTFSNNSDDDANFLFATSVKAFQDGVQLEEAILTDADFDVSDSLKDIKPGKSLTVHRAFVLDGTSDVSIEVTELISFDDTMLASRTFSVQ